MVLRFYRVFLAIVLPFLQILGFPRGRKFSILERYCSIESKMSWPRWGNGRSASKRETFLPSFFLPSFNSKIEAAHGREPWENIGPWLAGVVGAATNGVGQSAGSERGICWFIPLNGRITSHFSSDPLLYRDSELYYGSSFFSLVSKNKLWKNFEHVYKTHPFFLFFGFGSYENTARAIAVAHWLIFGGWFERTDSYVLLLFFFSVSGLFVYINIELHWVFFPLGWV